jgi:hypothetical protein
MVNLDKRFILPGLNSARTRKGVRAWARPDEDL